MPTLLLPPHHTDDDQALWRVAVGRGWRTFRDRHPANYATVVDESAYYGGLLHWGLVAPYFWRRDQRFQPAMIDPLWVASVHQADVFGRIITPIKFGRLRGFDGQKFVKLCAEKWFKPFIGTYDQIPAVLPDDWLHVQTLVEFVTELRCFVVDGKIRTGSFYRVNGRPHLGSCIGCYPALQAKVGLVAHALPRGVVLDFGQMRGSAEWYVVEANEAWASGIYECQPDECFDTVLASQL